MTPNQSPVETKRYYLPNERPLEGWAEVVITSGGFFATVSDYGNYSFAWRSFGEKDFRIFLLEAEKDTDYFTKKLQAGGDGPGDEYDGEATVKRIKETIIELRRNCGYGKTWARREWDLLDAYDVQSGITYFSMWYGETEIEDAGELSCYRRNRQAKMFVERVLAGRLCPIFRAELKAEGLL